MDRTPLATPDPPFVVSTATPPARPEPRPPARRSRRRPALLPRDLMLTGALAWLGASGSVAPADAQLPFVGLSSVRSQMFENENLILFEPQPGDGFGRALATGDFNGDGADDLAVGIPYDDGLAGSQVNDAGIVIVRYGIPGTGLAEGLASTVLSRFAAASAIDPRPSDRFGSALAAGDFNGDQFDDLAVGVPGSGYCSTCVQGFGVVEIFLGSPNGLELVADQILSKGWWVGNYDVIGPGDAWGSVLAAGNFDGDGYADLAIGAPSNDYGGSFPEAGAVWVFDGSQSGFSSGQAVEISPGAPGIPGGLEASDWFGFSLAVGNFNGDTHSVGNDVYPFDDLAIGVPGEDLATGKVLVLFGSVSGLQFGSNLWYGEGEVGSGGAAEPGDYFGYSLASEDFDSDLADDLAIGAPFEDLPEPGNSTADSGAVTVLYGTLTFSNGSWFDLARTDLWTRSPFFGGLQPFTFFGFALQTFDYSPRFGPLGAPFGYANLAIGLPGEDLAGVDRGGFLVLRGDATGVGSSFRFFTFGSAGLPGTPTDGLLFGQVFASGDFDGDRYADLVSAAPDLSVGGVPGAGAVVVQYGSVFADGFDGGNAIFWSSSMP